MSILYLIVINTLSTFMTTLFGELSKLLLNYVLPLLYYPWFARAYCSSSCKICAFSWSFHNTVLGILLLLLPSCIPSILFGMCWRLAWIAPLFFCVWPNHDYYDDDYWGWQTHVACQMGLWMKVPKKCTPRLLTRFTTLALNRETRFRFSQHHSNSPGCFQQRWSKPRRKNTFGSALSCNFLARKPNWFSKAWVNSRCFVVRTSD